MALSFTLSFQGLCAFVDRGTETEVYLPGGDEHGALLAIPADHVDIGAANSWEPTYVATYVDKKLGLRQLAIWALRSKELTAAGLTASGQPTWSGKDLMIEFVTEHDSPKLLTKVEIQRKKPTIGFISLRGKSTLTPILQHDQKFQLRKANKATKDKNFSEVVEWAAVGVPTLTDVAGRVIALKNSHIRATITNVAPLPDGTTHFHHYYEGVELNPEDTQLTIVRVTKRFENVYDCVPLVAWN